MQPSEPSGKLIFSKTVQDDAAPQACDYLALETGLSKARVKDAMNKGALRLFRKGRDGIRLRKATYRLMKGDKLELCYDPKVLSVRPPSAICLEDHTQYSIWFKPASLLTQGTHYGDHASLVRQVDIFFHSRREVYPVHRLDREAEGMVMVAHSRAAAGKLSKMFLDRQVVKRYRVEVLGGPEKDEGTMDEPLDGKVAVTHYRIVSRHPDTNSSVLLVEIETGRLHQIRRHLAKLGVPVMGDPRYGEGNKDGKPMRLFACELEWRCPFTGGTHKIHLPRQHPASSS